MRRIPYAAKVTAVILVVALLVLHVFMDMRSLASRFERMRTEGEIIVRLHDVVAAIQQVRRHEARSLEATALPDPRAESSRSELIAALDRLELTAAAVPLEPSARRALRAIGHGSSSTIQANIARIDQEIRTVIRQREADLDAQARDTAVEMSTTTWQIGLGGLAALIGTAVVIVIQRRQVTDRDFARSAMAAANEELRASLQQARERSRVIEVLGRMGELLQISANGEDIRSVVNVFGSSLFRACNGAVYSFGDSKDVASLKAAWGTNESLANLSPGECWSLRRGSIHVSEPGQGIRCRHATNMSRAVICVPMLAQGETTGVLSIEMPEGKGASEGERNLAKALGDQLSLTISNLKLKESLRALAIRDGLTGLYNRRYMEESLGREFRRAKRHGGEIAVFMVDIDHFKSLNDTYGHAGGDLYLQEFARLVGSSFRAEDIVCRYGGEEFAVILPDPSELDLRDRAEKLRQAIARLEVRTADGATINTSVSIGIAVAPRDGMDSDRVLGAADRALYQAKRGGRNRVVVANDDVQQLLTRPQAVAAS